VVKADFESYAEGFSQHPFVDVPSGIVLTREGGFAGGTDQQTVEFANSLGPGQPADAPAFYRGNHFLAGNGFTPGDGWGLSGLYNVDIAFPLACSQIALDVGHTNLGTITVTALDASNNVVTSDALTIMSDEPKWGEKSFRLDAPLGVFITRASVRVTGDVAVGYDNIQGMQGTQSTAIPLPPAAPAGLLALSAAGIFALAKTRASCTRGNAKRGYETATQLGRSGRSWFLTVARNYLRPAASPFVCLSTPWIFPYPPSTGDRPRRFSSARTSSGVSNFCSSIAPVTSRMISVCFSSASAC
jgi:hypothetical protein